MNEASVYIVERNAWSIERQRYVHFRLTYERVFLPVQDLWRDFLVHCEEIGSGLPTANQFSTGKMTEAQGRMHSSMAQLSYDEPLRTTIAEP
jgi:hypothetical protein